MDSKNISEINLPLFTLVTKVAANTIGFDLVSVSPMSQPSYYNEKNEKIKREVISINRDRKIDSMVSGVEYEEMKLEDHPDYKSIGLNYIDFKYT